MKKIIAVLFIPVMGLLLLSLPAMAQHDHGAHGGHGGHGGGAQGAPAGQQEPALKMTSTDVFADGLQATFMVMRNEMHRGMLAQMKMKDDVEPGTTHDVMVLLRDEKTGREFTDLRVTLKVVGPDDQEQVKPGNYKSMMRTYDTYFKLKEPGRYQIFVLFETGGQKRVIGLSSDL